MYERIREIQLTYIRRETMMQLPAGEKGALIGLPADFKVLYVVQPIRKVDRNPNLRLIK